MPDTPASRPSAPPSDPMDDETRPPEREFAISYRGRDYPPVWARSALQAAHFAASTWPSIRNVDLVVALDPLKQTGSFLNDPADPADYHPEAPPPAPRSGDGDPTPPELPANVAELLTALHAEFYGGPKAPADAFRVLPAVVAALASQRAARARVEQERDEAVRLIQGHVDAADDTQRGTWAALMVLYVAALRPGQPEAVSRDA